LAGALFTLLLIDVDVSTRGGHRRAHPGFGRCGA
jgi:hypothetical protein